MSHIWLQGSDTLRRSKLIRLKPFNCSKPVGAIKYLFDKMTKLQNFQIFGYSKTKESKQNHNRKLNTCVNAISFRFGKVHPRLSIIILNQGWTSSVTRSTSGPSKRLQWPEEEFRKNLQILNFFHL